MLFVIVRHSHLSLLFLRPVAAGVKLLFWLSLSIVLIFVVWQWKTAKSLYLKSIESFMTLGQEYTKCLWLFQLCGCHEKKILYCFITSIISTAQASANSQTLSLFLGAKNYMMLEDYLLICRSWKYVSFMFIILGKVFAAETPLCNLKWKVIIRALWI
jgi:hypothetical protein